MLIQAPPRQVPPGIQRAANRENSFWFIGLGAVMFGGLGLILAWFFFPWKFYQDWQLRDAPLVPGHVLSAHQTNVRINKQRVYRYEFEFVLPAADRIQGTSFTTGRQWDQGSAVEVRYRPENPAVCCIAGARSSESPGGSALVLLVPVGAIVLAGLGIRTRRRLQFLLEYGQVTKARVLSVEELAIRVNQQRVCRILLQRLDPGAGGPITVRKHQPTQVALLRERLASGQPVIVLYDPAHPERMLLPEALV